MYSSCGTAWPRYTRAQQVVLMFSAVRLALLVADMMKYVPLLPVFDVQLAVLLCACSLCEECAQLIDNQDRIRLLSLVHSNIAKVSGGWA